MKEACSGLGTDNERLIEVLCSRTKTQLERIDQAYRTKYEKTLWEKVTLFLVFSSLNRVWMDVNVQHFPTLFECKKRVLEVLP